MTAHVASMRQESSLSPANMAAMEHLKGLVTALATADTSEPAMKEDAQDIVNIMSADAAAIAAVLRSVDNVEAAKRDEPPVSLSCLKTLNFKL